MSNKTKVTFEFTGPAAAKAANAFLIQFADGGLDEDIEERLDGQGIIVGDTDFDLEAQAITIETVAQEDEEE